MSREAAKNEEKRINNTLTEWTVEKFLDMRKELLDRQKDLEKSNLEMVEKVEKLSNELQSKLDKIIGTLKPEASSEVVEKIKLSDEKIEKLSKKFDSIQSKLNQIDKTLKPVVSSEIGKLSNKHQEKFDSIQSKLDKVVETLKPEVWSEVVENIKLSDEKIEKLRKEQHEKFVRFDMRTVLLNKQKDLEKSNYEIVEKIKLSDAKIKNLSKDHREKLDSIQSKMNQIENTLKPEISLEIEKQWKEHQEKLDSIQSKLNQIDKTLKPIVSLEIEKLSKEHQEKFDSVQTKLDEIDKTLKPGASSEIEKNNDPATSGKYFVLKHTFKNVSSFKDKEIHLSEEEEHFGVPWRINVKRNFGCLGLFFENLLLKTPEKKWEIEVEYELKIVSPSSREKKEKSGGKDCKVFKSENDDIHYARGCADFIKWNELAKDFVVDDCFCVEIAVKVKKMTGIYKSNLRSFDKTMEKDSDVVLIVNDEKFYVLKLQLATDSPYFNKLFFGKSTETEKTEIKLSGIDADDVQNYLEVLYGQQAIDEFTVEGILMVAVRYRTRRVIEKCEYFLQYKSNKTLKKKLQLSKRYNLAELMKQCIEYIK